MEFNLKRIVSYCVPVCVLIIVCYSPSIASPDYYPTKSWRMSTPEEQGMHSENLLNMMEEIKISKIGIQSVTVVRNGYIVLDSYIHPYEDGYKHKMWSVTKSVISALVGIAIDKGFIKSVDQKVIEFFPDKEILNLDDRKKSISLKNLLMMASGLQANDGVINNWTGTVKMVKSNDWTQYALNLPMETAPGERFEYSNCNAHLLSAVIDETTGMKTIAFAIKYIFEPLGIENIKWEISPEGVNIGYTGLWLEPKDMAKFGLLYLNKGKWEDKQIISSKWINESTQPNNDKLIEDIGNGYLWSTSFGGVYYASGHLGQFIYVVPDQNLVSVFTGNIEGKNLSISEELRKKYIWESIASSEPLPPNPEMTSNLNTLVNELAKGSGESITWIGLNVGLAKDGLFKRTADPSFSFEYPIGSTKAKREEGIGQIMRMKTSEGDLFDAAVIDIPEGIKLVDFASKYYSQELEKFGSHIKVISNKEITLKCGTRAYKSDIEWLRKDRFPTPTTVVSAYKNGKCIYLATHPFQISEKVAHIAESLTFK